MEVFGIFAFFVNKLLFQVPMAFPHIDNFFPPLNFDKKFASTKIQDSLACHNRIPLPSKWENELSDFHLSRICTFCFHKDPPSLLWDQNSLTFEKLKRQEYWHTFVPYIDCFVFLDAFMGHSRPAS